MNRAKIIELANLIDNDCMSISASTRWPDVTSGLAAILRRTRELRSCCGGAGVERQISQGYHQEIEERVDGLADFISGLEGEELLSPETLVVCEMLSNMVSVTIHKYHQAQRAAHEQWEKDVAAAEAGFLEKLPVPVRPLDIDGEQEVANG